MKEKALHFISQDKEQQRWEESGAKQRAAWEKAGAMLKEKLETPQPIEKKVSKYKFYHCQWQLGDVFAYRFAGMIIGQAMAPLDGNRADITKSLSIM